MKIFIGSDHAGFQLKEKIKNHLHLYDVLDLGPDDEKAVDYPVYAHMVARQVLKNKDSLGILVCSTGIGMSIVANRFPHIRAALCRDLEDAAMSRKHNESNILCLGAVRQNENYTLEIVDLWLTERPEKHNRHERRVYLMDQLHIPL